MSPHTVKSSVATAAALALLVSGCAADADDPEEEPQAAEETPEQEEPESEEEDQDPDESEETDDDDAEPESVTDEVRAGSTEFVQDLWLFDEIQVISGGETTSVEDELFEWLESEVVEVVDLPWDAQFHVVEALDAQLLDGDHEVRDDVEVIAGFIQIEDSKDLALLGTVDDGAPTIGLQDVLDFDLTPVEGVTAGDVLTYNVALVQSHPADNPADELGLGGLELLAERLEAERVGFTAFRDEDGEIYPGYYGGRMGLVVEGSGGSNRPAVSGAAEVASSGGGDSDRTRLPAKFRPLLDGITKGVGGMGLTGVSRMFRNVAEGAKSSWDQVWDNDCIVGCGDPVGTGDTTGSSHGDPYITKYRAEIFQTVNFHLVGEFLLTSGDDWMVQKRIGPAIPRHGLTWNTGVAIESDGRRLTVQYENGEAVYRVDSEPVEAADLLVVLQEAGGHSS